ncbi:hypothetical protein [Puniceicoccus vermicola]|uniref:Uncharacterized protein n=1 Tax=Puniceicoccus vermicola TaxID=388746 RepID=A0A7X1AXQ9_9BACT|nr:hypothetical protein [Puniceicoccus vermicola]MBC2601887.1 hypothetical protein [Puniceicoccus vermicola]
MISLSEFRYTLLGLLLAGSTQAEILYEWNFEDPEGTFLTSVESSGEFQNPWDGAFDRSSTDGEGFFEIGRTPGGIANAYIDVSDDGFGIDPLWVVLEIQEWSFSGKSASETLRLGVVDSPDEERPHVLAQIRLERTGANEVSVLGESFGDGAVSMDPLPVFGAVQEVPVTLAMKIDQADQLFELYYQVADGPFLFLGKGKTSPDREINYLRFGLSGYFNASDEIFSIDRIAFQTSPPEGVKE